MRCDTIFFAHFFLKSDTDLESKPADCPIPDIITIGYGY